MNNTDWRDKPSLRTCLGVTEILEGSDQKFNITVVYVVRVLTEKVNSILDQRSSVSRRA